MNNLSKEGAHLYFIQRGFVFCRKWVQSLAKIPVDRSSLLYQIAGYSRQSANAWLSQSMTYSIHCVLAIVEKGGSHGSQKYWTCRRVNHNHNLMQKNWCGGTREVFTVSGSRSGNVGK